MVAAGVPLLLPVLAPARELEQVRRPLPPPQQALESAERPDVIRSCLRETLAAAAHVRGIEARTAQEAEVETAKRIRLPRRRAREVAACLPVISGPEDRVSALERLGDASPGVDGCEVEDFRDRARRRSQPARRRVPF